MPAPLDPAAPRDGGRTGTASRRGRSRSGRAGGRCRAWLVADISRERARQETVFQELQHAIDYLDHAPAGFFSAEPDGRIVYLNATLAEWLGIDLAGFEPGSADARRHRARRRHGAADVAGRRRRAQPHRDHRPRPGQAQRPEPAGAAAAPRAGDRRRRAGRDAHAGAQPQPGEDVSEALRAAEVRFARFFNNTPMAIAALDGAGPHRPHQRGVRAPVRGADRGRRRRGAWSIWLPRADRPKLEAALHAAAERRAA